MTIGELIKILEKCDSTAIACIRHHSACYSLIEWIENDVDENRVCIRDSQPDWRKDLLGGFYDVRYLEVTHIDNWPPEVPNKVKEKQEQ